jgi:hypothetical protein
MVADYFLARRATLRVHDLYCRNGIYEHDNGLNMQAFGSPITAMAVALPGTSSVPSPPRPRFRLGLSASESYAMLMQRAEMVAATEARDGMMGSQTALESGFRRPQSERLGASDLQHLRLNHLEYAIQHFDRGQYWTRQANVLHSHVIVRPRLGQRTFVRLWIEIKPIKRRRHPIGKAEMKAVRHQRASSLRLANFNAK